MEIPDFEARIAAVKHRAHGRWSELLPALGVDTRLLNRRNQPCPLCGGTDRFQFTDKFGEGNYHCRKCGPGGGFKLLQAVHGWTFGTTVKRLEDFLGVAGASVPAPAGETSPARMKALAKRLWEEAKPVTAGDDVDRYLRGRGITLTAYPRTLRCHPALGYFEKSETGRSKKVAEYPGMLACIQGVDGHAVTLHRTYLQEGRKASGVAAKKVLSAGINRAAVRLFEPGDLLAITEGIETALAVHLATGKPTWAAIGAGNLEKLWIPDAVRQVEIYADNDAHSHFDGQASAYALARRLAREAPAERHRSVAVFVPKQAGDDWADVWLSRQSEASRAA